MKENNRPKLLFIAATHGNEGYSIPVLKKIETNYPKEEWNYDWIVGNPRALQENVRYTEADLNRVAPGDLDSPVYEERRAAEIIEIAKDYDMVVDIHGADAKCGLVKIIPLPSIRNLALAALFPDLINVIWYSASSAEKGPPVQYMGKPAIELECDKNSGEVAEELYQVLARSLELKNGMNYQELLTNLARQNWYQVAGKTEDQLGLLEELKATDTPEGIRYPFLTNTYAGKAVYLLEKIQIEDKFLKS